MSTAERPAKRVRQACDPCRRKKSRCPGEKPICSYCSRLGQQCTYTDEGLITRSSISDQSVLSTPFRITQSIPIQSTDHNASDTNQRLSDLETKLSEVLVALQGTRRQVDSEQPSPAPPPRSRQSPALPSLPSTSLQSCSVSISPQILQQVADLYLQYCHCQPLPLFSPDQFSTTLPLRDEEVVLAISAIAFRFSAAAALDRDHDEFIEACLEKAKLLTVQRFNDSPIELSTLQSLCLMSWLEFYNGNTHRASMYSSLASDLCQSSNLANTIVPNHPPHDERLRCFWSIVLLQRLHPNVAGPFHISFDEDCMPLYPKSPSRPIQDDRAARAVSESRISDYEDLGIVAYAIQLTEVWYRVARYAHRRASAGPYPPWSSESDYAKIIAHQMDSETNMPYSKHRFKPAKFQERSPEELFQHRHYWGPWLFTQILYHTIICVLNHPLLLSLRLRNFRVASIPEIWLQHTDDLITQHSQWIIHLLDLLENKSFPVSDPFIAHCVAIVATIHLQQSFRDDEDTQRAKRENFGKCLRFCRKMGEKWPYVKKLAKKLQDFDRVVSDSYLNSAASEANDKIFIDLSLFWEILESAAISEKSDMNGLIFGQSLRTKTRPSIAAEELNARLLPEPARVVTAGSPANGITTTYQTPNATSSGPFISNSQLFPIQDDFSVLAQSYFAQGQDFVGNMDDWWLMDDSNQGA